MTVSDLTTHFKNTDNKINADLGTIRLVKPVGQGGNGLVYEAILHGKQLAVKFLLTESSGNTKISKEQRFLAEYFNVITLSYQRSIVRYYDYAIYHTRINDVEQHIPMILMELYEGSLSKLQVQPSKELFVQLGDFLIETASYIHASGIIHRDIKPENILHKAGQFVLTDFGIASYNPQLFASRATTKMAERLGNRLFSAPEQEISGVEAAATMDIYAIGQVLQWFATGSTHRGTGRTKITKKFPELKQYDNVIEKCLQHDPAHRFQTIVDLKAALKKEKSIDIFQDFFRFHNMLTRSFPRNEDRIVHTGDPEKINRLFSNIEIQTAELDEMLWCTSHHGDHDFNITMSPYTGRWKFGSLEYKIKELWVHYDSSLFNDFILVHYLPDEPFDFENKKYLGITVVDNQNIIAHSEANTGYAEINGEIITLSEHQTEYIEREQDEGYFLISTQNHCAHFYGNEEDVREFIENLIERTASPTIDEIKIFERKIRRRKPEEVSMRM